MKQIKQITLGLAILLIADFAYGQSNKEDIDMIQAMYGKNKKELVQAYMTIPDSSKTKFWSLYDQYETERKTYGKARISLIETYANAYETLSDKKATELMTKKLALNNQFGQLQKKYFDKMSKIIGARQAAKFSQLEDYLENNIRLAIQESIPFIDELDKTKTKEAVKQ
jgi:Spy/CpxP family protein refolding chaperone